MDGIWIRGKMVQRRYTFADGLSYRENGWDYCVFPDRRSADSQIASKRKLIPRIHKS